MSEEMQEFSYRIQKKNPKKNAKTYHIATVQDIANCVTSKNIKKFLKEFEIVLQMNLLMNAVAKGAESEGTIPKGAGKVLMPSFDWIDD